MVPLSHTLLRTFNLVPRGLFPGFGGAPKAREKRPGDEVGELCTLLNAVNALSTF